MTASEKKLTRRSFLTTTALAAGALATASMAGCSSVSTDEKPEASPETSAPASEPAPVEEKTYSNWCRGNCGAMSCCLDTVVREGKIVSTRQHPVKAQQSIKLQPGCVKAASNIQRIYGNHRLLYPMLQAGERGSDNWERISWDEALSMIAEKMQAAFDEYGPESVGFLSSYSGNSGSLSTVFGGFTNFPEARAPLGVGPERFLQKTGASIFTATGDAAGLYMQMVVLGVPGNSPEDAVNAKNIFLFGNPCDSSKAQWTSILDAKERGAKLTTIDPRFSNTAAHSDLWIPVRPSTDGALILAACNYIIDNDLIDYDYLRNKSVAPLLVKEDGSYLRLSDLDLPLCRKEDPATGETVEVDTEVVYDEVSKTFGSSFEIKDPAFSGTFDANGESVRTVYDLAYESIKPFTVEYAANECGLPVEVIESFAQSYADGPSFILTNWGFQHYQNSWRMYYGLAFLASLTGNACKSGANYGNSLLSTVWLEKPVANPEATAFTVKDAKVSKMASYSRIPDLVNTGSWAGEDYTLRLLWIAGANPIECGIGYTEQIEAWKKIDFVVVAAEYVNDTVRQASLALPVTMAFEAEDLLADGLNQKAIDPVGESKSDFEIFVELAKAMGYDDLYDKDAEGYLRELLDTEDNIAAGLDYDSLHEKGFVFKDAFERNEVVGAEYNPTGRTQFYLESLYSNGNWDAEITQQDRLPYYEHAFEAYPSNPAREQYPLFAVSYHDNYTGHSMHNHVPWLNELRGLEGTSGNGEPYTVIHESAAAERGIKTGDKIRVFNSRGSFVTLALVSKGIREDTITVPRGYAGDEMMEGHLQSVTSIEARDKVTNNDSHNDWICQVEKM
ncbi:molybdopterin-containing oxidoreductase family protein [Xiamenia xianingshaonis]|uniref:Molybdopterin-dependent oxidoreductase n=1 Tax=Xiamenia xianingshaonis TaxID=2682776 RepID=A0A9E6MPT0_9ACTN|nr:molybdopterin-dependent oxidoreductase [Xiamenia xianingshaonis]NHM14707.1 molybdopterin-dependent oxidoreductase [Xiamenia xianingshaonis]QTU83757.1 molybdopterin-dependent oxidoreductase [Xiamenia xianingshaonis]